MRILNSPIVPKYIKGFWAFWHFSLVQSIKKTWRWDPLKAKNSKKKSHSAEKKLKEGIVQSRPLSQMLEKVSG